MPPHDAAAALLLGERLSMEANMEDTIYAPSSAIGGAIAVIRISGPDANRTTALIDCDPAEKPRRLCHADRRFGG